jgi:hypothetical protein
MGERLAVTMAIRRPDGSVENVQVGTAVRTGDVLTVTLEPMQVGAAGERPSAARGSASRSTAGGGGVTVFPNYGRSRGQPIAGASMQDLEFYANGARRTLNDPNKARFHDKERALLAAIEAEIARRSTGGDDGPPPHQDSEAPPPADEDPPF